MYMVGKMSKFMTFVINLMVSKAISTDNIVLAFIQKIIAVSFDGKRMLSEIIFLMDMQEISAPTNLYKNLEIPGAQSKLYEGWKFNGKFMGGVEFLSDKIIDQPTTVNN